MKITRLTSVLFIAASLFMMSCSGDDSNNSVNEPDPEQPGELVLVAIDTARVVTMNAAGMDETIVLDRLENLNSYISELSISPDGEMVAYTNYQSTGTWPDIVYTRELRVANSDGTNDHSVYSSDVLGVEISAVRFCSDDKVFFIASTPFPDVTRTIHTVNSNGTGLATIQGQYDLDDVTDDREYYLVQAMGGTPAVQIIDRDADNGAGGLYHNESFAGIEEYAVGAGSFTQDGKLAVIPYLDGSSIKARVIDLASKTSTTTVLVSGITAGWLSFNLEMASDSNRGVLTVTGEGYAKSKSYVFNLETGAVAAPFENNDENIYKVYAH